MSQQMTLHSSRRHYIAAEDNMQQQTILCNTSNTFASQNTCGGRSCLLFNTLQPHKDSMSNIDGLVTMATLTKLSSFLFTLTNPHFFFHFLILGWPPVMQHKGLPVWVGPSLYLKIFFSIIVILILLSLPSSPFLLRPFQVALSQNNLDFPQSALHTLPPTYILGLPLQHPTTLPPLTYRACPSMCSIDSYNHLVHPDCSLHISLHTHTY